MTQRRKGRLLVLVSIVSVLAAPTLAQTREQRVYEPPTITAREIGLLEAVRLALQHDPNIRLQEETTDFFGGIFQEQTGRFDTTLFGNFLYQFSQQELTREAKKGEIDKRKRERDEIDDLSKREDAAVKLLGEIEALERDPEKARVSDPDIQEQIDLFNALLEGEDDPQLRAELEQLRADAIQLAKTELNAELEDIRKELTKTIDKLRKLGAVPEIEQSTSSSLNLRLQKPTRSGIVLEPFLNLTGQGSAFAGKRKEGDFGGPGVKDLYRSDLGFRVDVPLGRGAGFESTTAFERSSRIEFDASRSALRHSSATTVFATALAYWDLVAAQQRVGVFEGSEVLQARLVQITQTLIEADELPRAELPRVQASQANILVTLFGARRTLHEARVNLARTIGLSVEDETNAPLASDPFPEPPPAEQLDRVEPLPLIIAAVGSREDLSAALQRQEAGAVLMRAAELDLRPIFSTLLEAKYSGVGEDSNVLSGLDKALLEEWVGPSARMNLTVDWPIQNNTFLGRFVQQEAAFRQRAIGSADLKRIIKSNVVLTLGSLKEAAAAVRLSEDAVGYYRELIENEIEKLRLGQSTLIDTILTEQRLTEARLSEVSSRQQYASLLAQLRFETGMLVHHEPEGSVVTREDLVTVPLLPGGSR